ncbi:MAG: hypothetical protein ACRDBO_06205 [Lachnospiraceae bacterium]
MSEATSHVQGTGVPCQRTYKVEDIAAVLGIGRTISQVNKLLRLFAAIRKAVNPY